MQRRRSGMAHNAGVGLDTPFARIDWMGPDRFDLYRMRGSGTLWRVHEGVTLAESLRLLEENPAPYPV
jgi:hypothetical protein